MFTKTSLTLITIFAVNFGFVCKVYSNQDQVNTYYAFDLGVYSLEELNYETCKIYDHRRANKEGNLYIKNLNDEDNKFKALPTRNWDRLDNLNVIILNNERILK